MALPIALTFNNLDVPKFLLLIYPQVKKERERERIRGRSCLCALQTHFRLITLCDRSDEVAVKPRPPASLLSSDC